MAGAYSRATAGASTCDRTGREVTSAHSATQGVGTEDLGTQDWELWSTTARLVVTDARSARAARAIADRILAEIEMASSRFRSDSELSLAGPDLAEGVDVSPLLALLIDRALDAARLTDGAVDPTLGRALASAGYDVDIRLVEDSESILRAVASPRPGWECVERDGTRLRLPAGLAFDLGATAKAVAADLVAAAVVREIGCGALVSLGGDIATAGHAPEGGWNVLVQDLPGDPATRVRLSAGFGMATSSTQKRRWLRAGDTVHHILDPQTGLPADPVWRTVTVSAPSCLIANALSTASIVRGESAVSWLGTLGADARLVHRDGRIVTLGGWPAEDSASAVNVEPADV